MPPDRPPGPFSTEAEVRALPAVRAVYEAFRADPGVGKMTAPILSMLLDVLAAAGVYLGPYDHEIAEWLANWEPQTVAVIAGWVQRASEGPPGRETGDGPPPEGNRLHTTRPPSRALAAGTRITRGGHDGRATREAAP